MLYHIQKSTYHPVSLYPRTESYHNTLYLKLCSKYTYVKSDWQGATIGDFGLTSAVISGASAMQTGKDISGTARLTRYTAFSDLFTSCAGQEFSLVAMTSTTVSAYTICGGDSAFSTVGTATAYAWLGFPFEYFGLSA